MNNCVTVDPSHHPQTKIFSGPRVSHLPIKIINLYWGFFCVFRRHDKNKKEKGKKETSLCPASFLVMLASTKSPCRAPCLHHQNTGNVAVFALRFTLSILWTERVGGVAGSAEGTSRKCCFFKTCQAPNLRLGSMPVSQPEGQGDGQELLVLSPAPPSLLVF